MISRRDFLDGMAISVAAGTAPWPALLAANAPRHYPPALTGLRGSHAGAFETAHALARDGKTFSGTTQCGGEYDLVIVGGGISGLAAAWFYQQRHGTQARILILENHDDFGGHARRNEFAVDGRLLVTYGGSESLQSPRALFSADVRALLAELTVDVTRFETAFDRRLYPSLGLSRGVFFDRETFGRDALVTGDGTPVAGDDIAPGDHNARPWAEFIGDFPLTEPDRAALIALHASPRDYLAGMTPGQKRDHLNRTSYRDYLLRDVGLGENAVKYFQARSHDYMAIGIDGIPASAALEFRYPGFDGLGLTADSAAADAAMEEPYIYHFPDGNAALARLLVRRLMPLSAPGRDMDDVVLAPFDYTMLDVPGKPVRLRLNSTVVSVRNHRRGVQLEYVNSAQLHRVHASHCVLACYHSMIPYLMPELPAAQREAQLACVKAPLVYSKVALRNWEPFVRLGVHEIYSPMAFSARVKLDYPVTLGGYRHPRRPDEPMVVHMVHVPTPSVPGLSAREQARAGRAQLLQASFASIEARIRDQLDRMLRGGGFDSSRDIRAITVNRWSHGYSYSYNSLFDRPGDGERIPALARQRCGNVTIANCDAAWSAYAHAAIDQARRAVDEFD
jgi:spermidine dehydrogenase